jgi:cell division inhibitor SulA
MHATNLKSLQGRYHTEVGWIEQLTSKNFRQRIDYKLDQIKHQNFLVIVKKKIVMPKMKLQF